MEDKLDVIIRVGFIFFYILMIIANVKLITDWNTFLSGAAVMCCILGIIQNIKRLLTNEDED